MISAGVFLGDLGASTEFSDPDHERFVEESTLVEVVEECREGFVGWRGQVVSEPFEIVAVRVPEVLVVLMPVDADETASGFDEASGHQYALTVNVATVAFAGCRGFTVEIEGLPDGGRIDQVHGGVEQSGVAVLEWGGLLSFDPAEEISAGGETIESDLLGKSQPGDLKFFIVRVPFDEEGIVAGS